MVVPPSCPFTPERQSPRAPLQDTARRGSGPGALRAPPAVARGCAPPPAPAAVLLQGRCMHRPPSGCRTPTAAAFIHPTSSPRSGRLPCLPVGLRGVPFFCRARAPMPARHRAAGRPPPDGRQARRPPRREGLRPSPTSGIRTRDTLCVRMSHVQRRHPQGWYDGGRSVRPGGPTSRPAARRNVRREVGDGSGDGSGRS